MVNYDLIAQISSLCGTTFACFFFFSPIVLFIELCKTKSTYKIPYLMIIFNCTNTFLWVVYGLAGHDTIVYLCNGIALVANAVYLCWFLLYHFKSIPLKLSLSIISLGIIAGFVILGLLSHYNEDLGGKIHDPIGWCAMIFNIVMYIAPGQKIVSACNLDRGIQEKRPYANSYSQLPHSHSKRHLMDDILPY